MKKKIRSQLKSGSVPVIYACNGRCRSPIAGYGSVAGIFMERLFGTTLISLVHGPYGIDEVHHPLPRRPWGTCEIELCSFFCRSLRHC